MHSRRGFIGSVIGAFMAQDFFARLETQPFQFEEVKKYPYRLLFREGNSNKIIQSTPIMNIVRCDEPGRNSWQFVAGHFDCTQTLLVKGAILVDDRGRVIGENPFVCDVHTVNGDQLRVIYSLDADPVVGVQTADELCALMLESQINRRIGTRNLVNRIPSQEFLEDYRRKHGREHSIHDAGRTQARDNPVANRNTGTS